MSSETSSADLGGFGKGLAGSHRNSAAARRIGIGAASGRVVLAGAPLENDTDRFDVWNLLVGQLRHAGLADECGRNEWRQLLLLALDALVFTFLQRRHHLVGEKLNRFADMLMPVHARLLDEDHLVDAGIGVALQMLAHALRRADAAGPRRFLHVILDGLKALPQIGAARTVLAVNRIMRDRITEEAKTSAPTPFLAARKMLSRREHAIQIGGCGFCTGFGTMLRTGIEKNCPA